MSSSHEFPPSLVDRSVRITWIVRNSDDGPPWETFRVLDAYGQWVRLIGIEDPTRADERTTQGQPWWCRVCEIEEIEELPETNT